MLIWVLLVFLSQLFKAVAFFSIGQSCYAVLHEDLRLVMCLSTITKFPDQASRLDPFAREFRLPDFLFLQNQLSGSRFCAGELLCVHDLIDFKRSLSSIAFIYLVSHLWPAWSTFLRLIYMVVAFLIVMRSCSCIILVFQR